MVGNVALGSFVDMYYIKWYVLAYDVNSLNTFTDATKNFQRRNLDLNILGKNYNYVNSILTLNK